MRSKPPRWITRINLVHHVFLPHLVSDPYDFQGWESAVFVTRDNGFREKLENLLFHSVRFSLCFLLLSRISTYTMPPVRMKRLIILHSLPTFFFLNYFVFLFLRKKPFYQILVLCLRLYVEDLPTSPARCDVSLR